jgi:RNA polymerase sigma-70 factor (ECF subfamily)
MPTSATSTSDAELAALARQGDRAAFTSLLRRHDARLRGLAYRLLADRHAMDHVLAVAYLRAHDSLHRLKPGSDVGTWLYRITYNACVDELRERRRPRAASGTGSHRPDGSPARAASAAETVRGALERLPTDQRVTVVLVDGEGFDHRAVAEIIGVPASRVAARLHRARATLRRIVGEEVR